MGSCDSPFEIEALVLKSIAGDQQAFEQLVTIYHGRLLFFIRRIIRDPDSAEDVLQNVWIAVYRQLPGLQSIQSFPVWLYKIARNLAYREIRGSIKERNVIESLEDIYDEVAGSDEDLFLSEEVTLLKQSLEQLRPEHREVLSLKFMESMSYQEIAEIVGCNLGTVRSRIHYAKQALAKQIEALRK